MLVSGFTRAASGLVGSITGGAVGSLFGGVGMVPGAARGAAGAMATHDLAVGVSKGAIYGVTHGGVGALPGAMLGVESVQRGETIRSLVRQLVG